MDHPEKSHHRCRHGPRSRSCISHCPALSNLLATAEWRRTELPPMARRVVKVDGAGPAGSCCTGTASKPVRGLPTLSPPATCSCAPNSAPQQLGHTGTGEVPQPNATHTPTPPSSTEGLGAHFFSTRSSPTAVTMGSAPQASLPLVGEMSPAAASHPQAGPQMDKTHPKEHPEEPVCPNRRSQGAPR